MRYQAESKLRSGLERLVIRGISSKVFQAPCMATLKNLTLDVHFATGVSLFQAPCLETIRVSGNFDELAKRSLLKSLESSKELRSLWFDVGSLSCPSLCSLFSSLTLLKEVVCDGLTDESLDCLSKKNLFLERIHSYDSRITDASLVSLHRLQRLVRVDFEVVGRGFSSDALIAFLEKRRDDDKTFLFRLHQRNIENTPQLQQQEIQFW